MKKTLIKTASLGGVVALALSAQTFSALAQADLPQVVKDNLARAKAQKLEKCYGINAVGKNDCAVGKHSCAGQATKERDPESIVLVPAGTCDKIAGGKTTG
ncbi:putative membrane protein [Pelomonas saccharophila]|uniref:Membrane protein n=1 Tax=Roseateles saccharophilus TaxID=304 RepID=A0ABU1YWH6_ROSSA|nr:DUF2282 domain-containing protein [Roseateles saccharophilus]MDR7273214.1 putative membrane protein [Roseateles saccharophilus]